MRAIALSSLIVVSLVGCARPQSPSLTPSVSGGSSPSELARGVVIANATLVDGTGAPRRMGGVRIAGGRIASVGDVTALAGERVIDAHGLVLAPGFIDTHSHADGDLRDDTTALAVLSQGITTIVGGQDGGSPPSVGVFLAEVERRPAPINIGMYVGHGTLRERVMGEDFRRVATPNEIERMRAILREELAAGAIGLSSGLEYDPGIYSATDELIALLE